MFVIKFLPVDFEVTLYNSVGIINLRGLLEPRHYLRASLFEKIQHYGLLLKTKDIVCPNLVWDMHNKMKNELEDEW